MGRQQEIEEALDLTKNQTSSQLGTENNIDPPFTADEPDTLKEDYDDTYP